MEDKVQGPLMPELAQILPGAFAIRDLRLDHEATRTGVSKAALVRRFVRDGLQPLPPLQEDPLFQMIGVDDVEPMDVDSVVYS